MHGQIGPSLHTVAFSPVKPILASGSQDGTIKLWDVATKGHIATLEAHSGSVFAVAFSPDGTTLASAGITRDSEGDWDSTVKLWDVATRRIIATLEEHSGWVRSVAFSPDGTILASGSWDNTVKLWDVATWRNVATLGTPNNTTVGGCIGRVHSVAFSADGAILASGVIVGNCGGSAGSVIPASGEVQLWDVSELDAPRPQTLEIISGNNQQLSTGSELASPLVVEVRDQNGDPLQSVQVIFAVTTGNGKLNGRSTVDNATTDANGRAEIRLTLGGNPGTTVVKASVTGLDPVTFNAVAVESPTAGSNANAVLSLDLIADGGAGNQTDDGVASGTVSGQGTKIAVEVFATGVKTPLQGIIVKFDFDDSILKFDKAENSAFTLAIQETGGTNFASTVSVTISSSNFLAHAEFTTVADVTGRPFSIGIKVVTLAESETSSDDITTTKVISFNATPPTATFSLSLDGNTAAGDQAVTTLDISPGSVVSIQVFGKDIRDANGVSVRFEYDAAQMLYEGFDPGSVLPNAQVIPVPRTNPTAVEINMVSFGGQAAADSGLVGSIRFRTTDVFSGTTLRLVRAELGRGEQSESVTLSDTSVTLKLATLTPDFNGDGRVNFADFLLFGSRFGASRGDERYEAKYDLDEDGTIGFGDFLIFGREFGKEGS